MKQLKYSASFTIGSLLLHETEKVIDYLIAGSIEDNTETIIKENLLKLNAESSRGRVLREIKKRTKFVDKIVWQIFKESDENDKAIILFYVCCKTYQLILDFQSEVILDKYRTLNLDISNDDVLKFIDKKSIDNPEVDNWSDDRKYKVTRAILSILEQVGIIEKDKITPLHSSDLLWFNFIKLGDPWFLELALLNKQQRDKIYELAK